MLPSDLGARATWSVDFQTIATKADLSLRVVKGIVKQLEAHGEIEVIRGKRGESNTYRYLYREIVGQGSRHALRGQHVRTGRKRVENESAAGPGGFLEAVPEGKGVVDSTIDNAVDSTRLGVVDSTIDNAVDSTRFEDSTGSPDLAVVKGAAKPAQYGFALVNVEEGGARFPVDIEERVRRLMNLRVSDDQIILRCDDPETPRIIERLRAAMGAG